MKNFTTVLFVLMTLFGISLNGNLYSQCDVVILNGSQSYIDHNPGVSFEFDIQNNGLLPYNGGDFHLGFGFQSPATGAAVWDFSLSNPLLPGETTTITTPIFDIPLYDDTSDWPFWDTGQSTTWPAGSYDFHLFLDGCWMSFPTVTIQDVVITNDDCINLNSDQFCNSCDIEVLNFNWPDLTVEALDATGCYNPSGPNPNWLPVPTETIFLFQISFIPYPGQVPFISNADVPDMQTGDIITVNIIDLIDDEEYLNELNWYLDNGCQVDLVIQNPNNISSIESNTSNNTISIGGNEDCPMYLSGCTDPDANNYNPDAVSDDGSCEYTIIDLSFDTLLYDTGCDEFGSYWSAQFYLTNQGTEPINEWCINADILSTPENDTICFDFITIMPGETYIQQWPNVYDWGVLSLNVLHVNGDGGLPWNQFGEDNDVADNMYVQIISDEPNCNLGCTDPEANNYNPNANFDDGSCEYLIDDVGIDSLTYELDGCDGEPLYWTPEINITNYGETTITDICLVFNILDDNIQEDTICYQNLNILPNDNYVIILDPLYDGVEPINIYTELILEGDDILMNNYLNLTFQMWCYDCTDSNANNYNPYATDDQTPNNCEYLGCTDPLANNYNTLANVDDGSCEYDILGCTDPLALNYNPNANIDDSSCEYQEEEESEEEDCNDNVFAPNTFTPNNDGLNDVWKVYTGEDCWIKWDVKIFNRWGDIVYIMDSPSEFWNGSKMDGSHYVSDGVYLYTITGISKNRSYIETSGHISLFR
jgi:gliding motility-associated-like protein